MPDNFYGGLDFGTSGARISVININKELVFTNSVSYQDLLLIFLHHWFQNLTLHKNYQA